MHVFADLVYLESLSQEGEGQLLVTSLTNRQMPFIRYRLGDFGRLLEGECECGSPFPLMEMGMCRKNDLIRAANGKTFHPAFFNRLLYGLTQIRQYQWVQKDLHHMELHLVGPSLSADVLAGIESQLRREVDPAMCLVVNYLEAIPRSATGKHRFVIGLGD
jgi:phenylacetate-CoA ligase